MGIESRKVFHDRIQVQHSDFSQTEINARISLVRREESR